MNRGWLAAFLLSLCIPVLAFPTGEEEPSRCLMCHGNLAPVSARPLAAPDLETTFSMDWKMFEFTSDQRPPLSEPSGSVLPGQTFYDWHERSMTEIYPEKCIDIFPEGRDYPCQFLSKRKTTFFIRFKRGPGLEPDSCCRWSHSDFWAPRPDVLKNMVFDQELALGGEKTRWWVLDIPLPGPFGYGISGTATPAAFWFPVISGWVQQDFSNYSSQKPDQKHFELPAICEGDIPVCPNS